MTFYQEYNRYKYKGNLTYYDRLHFMVKIFHTEPKSKMFENDVRHNFWKRFLVGRRISLK